MKDLIVFILWILAVYGVLTVCKYIKQTFLKLLNHKPPMATWVGYRE